MSERAPAGDGRAPLHQFQGWPKTPRLNKQIVVTEKIDGTNAAVMVRPIGVGEDCHEHEIVVTFEGDGSRLAVGAQSRNRLLQPTPKTEDNAGFAAWVHENAYALARDLGVGRHFGEWWGSGIQRGYDQDSKFFSLFNPYLEISDKLEHIGVRTVPLLLQWGQFDSTKIDEAVAKLVTEGSVAAPGFMNPEGVVVRHSASGQLYKRLIENDDRPKTVVESELVVAA